MKSILVVGARGIPDVEGGVEKHAERLFPLFASCGWNICLAGMKPFIEAGEYRGVDLWRAPAVGIAAIDSMLYGIATWFKAARMQPDIAYFSGLQPALLLWAYKLIGCKIIVRYGADSNVGPRNRVASWATRWAQYQLRWADSIIAVTPALAKKLRAAGIAEDIHVIGNALDRTGDYPAGGRTGVTGDYILFVGQMSERKNIHSLVAAFITFAKNYPQMQLVIVGKCRYQKDRKQIAALGDDRIVMIDSLPRSELAPLYRGARFFVNPSIREGHSNTLLEAISFRCPVLLSDLPENRDLKLNAKHYFDPGNIGSMISALHRAHANPDAFRVNHERFPQWEEIAERTKYVCDNLLAGDSPRRKPKGKPSRI